MEGGPLGETFPEAGSVLIEGPPMTGKYRLFVSLLSLYCEQVGLVSTHARAEKLRSDFADAPGELPPERVGVVECARRPDDGRSPEGELVSSVSSPANLTAMGVEFTELAEALRASPVDGRTGIGIHSVSQLLMFSSVGTVYRFLQVLTGQVESNGWVAIAVLDDTTVDDEGVRTIEHLFGRIVETRERADRTREFRVRGSENGPTDWTPQSS